MSPQPDPKDLPLPASCWAQDWQFYYLLIYLFILLKIDLEPRPRFIKLVSVTKSEMANV